MDYLMLFIASMREAKPFGDVVWENSLWDLTSIVARSGRRLHIKTRSALLFSEHRESRSDTAVPFRQPFDDFAKAIICVRHVRRNQLIETHRVSVRALRYLYDAL